MPCIYGLLSGSVLDLTNTNCDLVDVCCETNIATFSERVGAKSLLDFPIFLLFAKQKKQKC
jgi:hypothetical protein